jgi:hypothetical protein
MSVLGLFTGMHRWYRGPAHPSALARPSPVVSRPTGAPTRTGAACTDPASLGLGLAGTILVRVFIVGSRVLDPNVLDWGRGVWVASSGRDRRWRGRRVVHVGHVRHVGDIFLYVMHVLHVLHDLHVLDAHDM